MSKVRIYDLAKEVGLKSKELADKLIAMGYPIASHSSSVDDDMAADIRKKLKGDPALGAAGGRIELRGRSENSAAKPKTVIRRRSKADKEEAAKRQEEADAQALEAEVQALEARLKAQEEAKEGRKLLLNQLPRSPRRRLSTPRLQRFPRPHRKKRAT